MTDVEHPADDAKGQSHACIRYRYQVSGKTYEGDRVSLHSAWPSADLRKEHPKGSEITVYYDPRNPSFAVLEPGSMDAAPHTVIMIARLPDAEERAAFQRSLVGAFPNVSALDFSRVQQAIDTVLGSVRRAVAFLGLFCALAGVLVLVGALAISRVQRTREGALLKTLGARRKQVLTVLLAEYLALGTLATATGLGLAVLGAWLLVPRTFQVPFSPQPGVLLAIWGAVVGLTVAVGLLGSRGLLAKPPLAVLREAPE